MEEDIHEDLSFDAVKSSEVKKLAEVESEIDNSNEKDVVENAKLQARLHQLEQDNASLIEQLDALTRGEPHMPGAPNGEIANKSVEEDSSGVIFIVFLNLSYC